MPSITVSDLSWSKPDGELVFSNINLRFGSERVGIVGRNGVGKSTLLEIIAAQKRPSTGSVLVDGDIAFARQGTFFSENETIAEIFGVSEPLSLLRRAEAGVADVDELAEADWTLEERIVTALARFGVEANAETPIGSLSGGQRTRVGLAAAVFAHPQFLLLDEPTNNLDREGRVTVIEFLKTWRGGAVIVSHDRELLSWMDAIVEMTSLGASRYGGNWNEYEMQKAIELEAARHDLNHAEKAVTEANRKAQVASERQDRRNAMGARKGARGDMPRILIGARKNAASASSGKKKNQASQQYHEAMSAVSLAKSRVETLQQLQVDLPSTGLPASRNVLTLENVSAGYRDGSEVIHNLSFSIVGPERIAVTGSNGTGKTTLLRVITGGLPPTHGTVKVNVPFSLLDQNVTVLDPQISILDNFVLINPSATENSCRASLARFLFKAESSHQRVGTLSGGQLLRAGLACVLGGPQPPSLLILDEPTNHLDIDSIEAIETGLTAYDGAMLVVSHDEAFLANVGITSRLELKRSASCD